MTVFQRVGLFTALVLLALTWSGAISATAATPTPTPAPTTATPTTIPTPTPTSTLKAPRPPDINAKGNVDVAIFVERIEQLDMATGWFDAFFTVGMRCPWDCTWDEFSVVNGKVSSVTQIPTGDTRKLWSVEARMFFTPELHDYPFDAQQLPIKIEHADVDARLVTFEPLLALSGLEQGMNVSGWSITGWDMSSGVHDYLDRDEFSQIVFNTLVDRNTMSSSFSVLLPALTMTLIALASLLLRDPRDQFRAGGTALLGMLLFWVGISNTIDQTAYITLLDKFMAVIYATIALVLLTAVIGELAIQRFEKGKLPAGETSSQRQLLHKWSIIGVPTFFAIAMLGVWLAH